MCVWETDVMVCDGIREATLESFTTIRAELYIHSDG